MIFPIRSKPQDYNLTVCSDPKIVWFRNAKVGTRSILALLDQLDVTVDTTPSSKLAYNSRRYSEHLKFAFVRNPWDRLLSGWKNKIRGQNKLQNIITTEQHEQFQSFDVFADYICCQDLASFNNHFRLQCHNIKYDALDILGRFENFNNDMKYILVQAGISEPTEIPHKNKSKNIKLSDFREYYSYKTKDLVERAYKEDINMFGYDFDQY